MASVAMLGSTLAEMASANTARSSRRFDPRRRRARGSDPAQRARRAARALAKVSIAKLLLAGLLPGLVLAALYFALFHPAGEAPAASRPALCRPADDAGGKVVSLLRVAPLFSLIVVVTASSSWGSRRRRRPPPWVVATIAIAACYRRLTWEAVKDRPDVDHHHDVDDAAGDRGIGGVFADPRRTGSTSSLVDAVAELDLSPVAMVIIMQLMVLILGCFIDTISIMMVSIPVFMPLVLALRARSDLVLHPDSRAARACRDHAALRRAAVRDEGRSGRD